mmetsp:Transcript_42761/g.105414  ORF Transcript_42761/g.105414 Transcript_42761/m.105414 type:complete len:208 (+) Transcript_42761:66-689(+)
MPPARVARCSSSAAGLCSRATTRRRERTASCAAPRTCSSRTRTATSSSCASAAWRTRGPTSALWLWGRTVRCCSTRATCRGAACAGRRRAGTAARASRRGCSCPPCSSPPCTAATRRSLAAPAKKRACVLRTRPHPAERPSRRSGVMTTARAGPMHCSCTPAPWPTPPCSRYPRARPTAAGATPRWARAQSRCSTSAATAAARHTRG